MTITVNLPDGSTAQFPDGTAPAVMQSAIGKIFPPTGGTQSTAATGATPAGPMPTSMPPVPPPASMLGVPSGSNPTPASASVVDMTGQVPQPTNGPPPAANGPPQAPPQPSTPQSAAGAPPPVMSGDQMNALALANEPLPVQALNFLTSVGSAFAKNPAGALGAFGRSATQALPVIGAPLAQGENYLTAAMNGAVGAGPTTPQGAAQQQSQNQQANPEASAMGTVAGTVAPMLIPGIGEAAEAIPAFGLTGGAANLVRAAIAGGTIAGADTLTRTGNLGDAALNAGIGAVAGPVIGKVAGSALGIASKLSPGATKAWSYIASKIGVDPSDLSSFITAHTALTGQQPSIQQVLDAHAAGAVKDFAQNNPQSAMILQKAQQDATNALPAQAQQVVQGTGVPAPTPTFLKGVPATGQAPQTLLDARDTAMDTAMGQMRDEPVDLPEDLRGDPDLANAMSGRLYRGLRERLDNNELTLGDVDTIRQQLNAVSPNSGSPFAQLAGELTSAASDQVPQYAGALQEYGKASKYIEGFNHSYPGQAPMETATNPSTRQALQTPEGQAGHAAGIQANVMNAAGSSPAGATSTLRAIAQPGDTQTALAAASTQPNNAPQQAQALLNAQTSVARSTPQSVAPAADGGGAENALIGGMEAAAGAHFGPISRGARAIAGWLKNSTFAPAVQTAVAKGLTSNDPIIRQNTLDRLASANVSATARKHLQTIISGMGGAASSSAMDSTRAK